MRKRPTSQRRPIFMQDPQQIPPRGWCVECGAEIYEADSELCPRCLRMEERKWSHLHLKAKNTSTN